MFNTRDDQTPNGDIRTSYRTFEVAPLTPHIGAEVRHVDLAAPLTNESAQDLHDAWMDWKVLVFRDQHLNRDQHKAFGRRFGTLHVHPMQHKYGGDPEILTVKTTGKSPYTAGDGWHTDVTCDAVPPLGSMLYVTETPECGGGDTLFADMYLAYEMLSEPIKKFLDGLTAVHDGAIPYIGSYKSTPPPGGYPRNEHPVVTRHPETGRKILYVNQGFTFAHRGPLAHREPRRAGYALQPYRLNAPAMGPRLLQPNTLTFWDNRCTQHHAVWDYYPHSRYGERVSILGTERPAA